MALELSFDTAWAIDKGQRCYQEDALISVFDDLADVGLVVLSDGMGGHTAGDVASDIVVTETHRVLNEALKGSPSAKSDLPASLLKAAYSSNRRISDHVAEHPSTEGMGATLLACVLVDSSLYWVSVGDSPLLLYRDGSLRQLNEDHSMTPQLEFMVSAGLLTQEEADTHPDRNVLTSALMGDDISKIDCPQDPLALQDGDILITASDGLQILSNDEIARALRRCGSADSEQIAQELMSLVLEFGDPDQDNISLSVVKAGQPATSCDISKTGEAGTDSAAEPASEMSGFFKSFKWKRLPRLLARS